MIIKTSYTPDKLLDDLGSPVQIGLLTNLGTNPVKFAVRNLFEPIQSWCAVRRFYLEQFVNVFRWFNL